MTYFWENPRVKRCSPSTRTSGCFGEVIFDPGHTPVGRGVAIPVARVQNPWL